jgi:thymidylate synthase (FAD)
MRRVEPEVFLVGESRLDSKEIRRFLKSIKAEEWYDKNQATGDGSEMLTEVMGRLCYKSWAPGLNLNVTKIREGNSDYIGNILKQKHGSVIEHGSTNWILNDVSRVFTHEAVRHRAGVAFSQESLRYVRMDDFGIWLPKDPVLTPEIVALCEDKVRADEAFCGELSRRLGLDDPKTPFSFKKKWTSFVRRFAPQGMATAIGVTINFRAMRHVIEMRTSDGAEVEIRLVFDKIARICKERWPALMQDFSVNDKGEWVPENRKV